MPKLEDIRIGVSPLTKTVYVGTVSKKHPGLWQQKREATSDFCAALLEWAPIGYVQKIRGSDGSMFEVEVRDITGDQQ